MWERVIRHRLFQTNMFRLYHYAFKEYREIADTLTNEISS
ncbi:hypothetical protein ES708_06590 [subsurface metagenome]